ncbi:hypothetical protein Nepgr_004805 [Nepenthes gracilis]|uniref:Uncharacterized protein n=1 Tax=Nepenthes gracilis TaxID=150966 RepID=A0AAD3S203_NEPGR|nr:hypothetical protein Nepgr_004805 [Nepenthes gracilis]
MKNGGPNGSIWNEENGLKKSIDWFDELLPSHCSSTVKARLHPDAKQGLDGPWTNEPLKLVEQYWNC